MKCVQLKKLGFCGLFVADGPGLTQLSRPDPNWYFT